MARENSGAEAEGVLMIWAGDSLQKQEWRDKTYISMAIGNPGSRFPVVPATGDVCLTRGVSGVTRNQPEPGSVLFYKVLLESPNKKLIYCSDINSPTESRRPDLCFGWSQPPRNEHSVVAVGCMLIRQIMSLFSKIEELHDAFDFQILPVSGARIQSGFPYPQATNYIGPTKESCSQMV